MKKLFELFHYFVEDIREEKVVQIITDKGSNYVLTDMTLGDKRLYLYWISCAIHCIDLMLKDIENFSLKRRQFEGKSLLLDLFIAIQVLRVCWDIT